MHPIMSIFSAIWLLIYDWTIFAQLGFGLGFVGFAPIIIVPSYWPPIDHTFHCSSKDI